MAYGFFYCHSNIKAKSEGGNSKERMIEGYFTTVDVDRSRDIVKPSALAGAISTFMKNPILCFNHDWSEGIGRIMSIQLDEYGCKVQAKIAEGTPMADKVWTLINQGVYNAFSFAFRVLGRESGGSDEDPIDVITNLDLLEVSVVTIPCNANATFSIVKGFEWGSDIFPKFSPEGNIIYREYTNTTGTAPESTTTEPVETFKVVIGSENIDSTKNENEETENEQENTEVTETNEPVNQEPVEKTETPSAETTSESKSDETTPVKETVIETVAETVTSEDEKKVTPYGNFDLASATIAWSGSKSRKELAEWASSDGSGDKEKMDWKKYSKGFFWYDESDSENFSAYKLPFCYVESGSLKAVPRGIFAAAGVVNGARGGLNIPEGDIPSLKSHIEKYYKKMDKESPFKGSVIDLLSMVVENGAGDEKLIKFISTYGDVKVFLAEYIMNSGYELDDEDLKLVKEVIKGLFL